MPADRTTGGLLPVDIGHHVGIAVMQAAIRVRDDRVSRASPFHAERSA